MNTVITFLLLISLLTAVLYFFAMYAVIRRYLFANKYLNYIALLDKYCNDAYEFIYKDQVVAFTSSGYRVTGEALETVKRNFVKLTIELLGPNLYGILVDYHGSESSLTSNLLLWFTRKLDGDEILKFAEQSQASKASETLDKIQKEKED